MKGAVTLLAEAEGKLADAIKAGNMENNLSGPRPAGGGSLSHECYKICNEKRGKHELSSYQTS